MFSVYVIKLGDVVRYVGYTGNLKLREKQHNYHYKKGTKKELYDNLRLFSYNDELVLEEIKSFNLEIEAKRFECKMILDDYFFRRELWQKVPNITDKGGYKKK
jgi:predicted GIY-YIG superfamily endonuclease